MMKLLIVAAAAALVGCAGPGTQTQAECERAHPDSFVAMYQCTADTIRVRRPDVERDARAKLYLLKGQQLARQVTDGKISDLDARVEWQQVLVQLRDQQDAEAARALAVMPRPAAPVNCTSMVVGGVTRTSCQ